MVINQAKNNLTFETLFISIFISDNIDFSLQKNFVYINYTILKALYILMVCKVLKNKHTKGMYNRILNTIAIVWYLKKYLYVKLIYCFLSDQII